MLTCGLTLKVIGESINDSIGSTRRLFEAGDFAGIAQLARSQDTGGADYIDVNVGGRPAEFLAEIVRTVQAATSKPLSIDTPDPAMAEAALKAYDQARSAGLPPILNSVSALRLEMLDLRSIVPFKPILLVSERAEGSQRLPNRTADEVHATARTMLAEAAKRFIPPADCLIDPAISPLATDQEGDLGRLIGAMSLLKADPAFETAGRSVGLSNFTVMLPATRKDGVSPTRNPLENAFLTLAVPLGLTHIIGSVKRRYEFLGPEDPAMACVGDCLRLSGAEALMRVRTFYTT
jgi:cobalamin-dependent methionine synthase I